GRFWDFKYQEADELPVFDTEFGKLGLLMCSEVYVPELARAMALKGAVITLLPAGLWSSELHDTWRTLLWARAIENLMITATSRNILPGGGGHAIAGSPEETLLEARPPGVFTATGDSGQQRKRVIYGSRIWVDEWLGAEPELAGRWERPSPTEYVFRLRRGVRFHGGKELDAEDVKYTYDRVRDPKVSPGANDLLVIKQIDVLDAHTVRFVLHAPAATFLINLGGKYNGVIPKGAAGDGRELLTRAIGTGPFGVEEFDPSRRLVLKRHAAYWGPTKPALERSVFQAIPDESSIVAGP